MNDNLVNTLLQKLIKLTKSQKVKWESISAFTGQNEELESYLLQQNKDFYDSKTKRKFSKEYYFSGDQLALNKSFYTKHNDGYIYLFKYTSYNGKAYYVLGLQTSNNADLALLNGQNYNQGHASLLYDTIIRINENINEYIESILTFDEE